MEFVKTNWQNLPSETTPINASNLNKIEQCLYNLTKEHRLNYQFENPASGEAKFLRVGVAVTITYTFPCPPMSGGVGSNGVVGTFPIGYKPNDDFVHPVFNTSNSLSGAAKYDYISNTMTFFGNILEGTMLVLDLAYLTSDPFITE